MTDATRLIDELSRVVEGDAWYGDSIRVILDGVSANAAAARPLPQAHTIWEIVRHMTAWTREVGRRVDGAPAGAPSEGDWPAPSGSDNAAWQRDVRALFDAHREMVERLASLPDSALYKPTNDPREPATGTGVSKDVMLHGLAQHHAYHGGQISLLKKLTA